MTDGATTTFEEDLIADIRSHGGEVTQGPLKGHPLLIMISEGAKSGDPRRAILTYSRDGDGYVVAGTAGGSKADPGWLHNVSANPEVTIEVNLDTMDATATTFTEGSERDRLWDQHVAALPHFVDYPAQTGRLIPMVKLTPKR